MTSSAPRTVGRLALGGALAFAGISHLTVSRQEFQAQVSAWSSWWSSSGGAFVIPRRVASLDLENIYRVPPVTLGSSIVR